MPPELIIDTMALENIVIGLGTLILLLLSKMS